MTEVTATSSTNSASKPNAATTGLTANYELFLSLLTTQVTHQDPLDPLDSAEYTNQLVQYSAVEQSIQTNSYLEDLLASFESSRASSYVSYLGEEVTASGATTMLRDGNANWQYSVQEGAGGRVEVRNALGAVVYGEDVSLTAGKGSWAWNGTTNGGGTAPEGAYTLSFEVFDAAGNAERVTTEITGVVDKVNMGETSASLKIGDVEVPVTSVTSVRTPS
ncbi:flagellar hook assembly protein FlgD [Roseibium sp. CAU 1637]|uniref:Basal-body rod modification protein FlgD n=1 Tax=Roseibium limicola TaxID=2816037 RepID=A0A939EMT8_9HYPH|nr:flagellar hook capping FlgD N-terminal domain-containing protein [Roseibium limicola]MBO0343894.1 flagellar hook assembly protein FlgD [Roseibium limicola]